MKTYLLILSSAIFWSNAANAQDKVAPVVKDTVKLTYPMDSISSDKIYVNVDEKAAFKGGNAKLSQFISDHIVYPRKAKRNNIQGEIMVSFIIMKDGTISDVRAINGPNDPLLEKEAIKVMQKTNGMWIPAKINGKPVKQLCQIPIRFELEN